MTSMENIHDISTTFLLPSPADLTSSCDRLLASRFERAFGIAPRLESDGKQQTASLTLSVPQSFSERPAPEYSLDAALPSKVARRFANKDTIMYLRPDANRNATSRSLAQAIFHHWYPLRPDLKYQAVSPSLQEAGHPSADEQGQSTSVPGLAAEPAGGPAPKKGPRDSAPVPTEAPARAALETAFCAPVRVSAEDCMPLSQLVRAHCEIVRRLKEVENEIQMDGTWRRGWSTGWVRLAKGMGAGFCLLEGKTFLDADGGDLAATTTSEAQSKDKVGLGHWLLVRVVGKKEWVVRSWGEETANNWEAVQGEGLDEWMSGIMSLEEAIHGVVRAGEGEEEGRFRQKPESEYFRETFIEPKLPSGQ